MKKSLLALVVVSPLLLGLTGCVIAVGGDDDGHYSTSDFSDREYDNRKKMSRLQPSMSIATIQADFGIADFNETYEKDGKTIQVLYYRTQRKHKDGLTTKDECSPLIFKDGVLTSWGDAAYSQL